MTAKTGLDALLTPERSVLLLIDHQPFQFSNLHSHDPTLIINNVVGLAKAAKAFKVPTILTTVTEERWYLPQGHPGGLSHPIQNQHETCDRPRPLPFKNSLDRLTAVPPVSRSRGNSNCLTPGANNCFLLGLGAQQDHQLSRRG